MVDFVHCGAVGPTARNQAMLHDFFHGKSVAGMIDDPGKLLHQLSNIINVSLDLEYVPMIIPLVP